MVKFVIGKIFVSQHIVPVNYIFLYMDIFHGNLDIQRKQSRMKHDPPQYLYIKKKLKKSIPGNTYLPLSPANMS